MCWCRATERGIGLGLLLSVLPACLPATLPSWAMHVKPPAVDVQARVERLEPKLIAELESGVYVSSHTAPEQIAVLAVHELERGHPWDAAVLLALASMRREEQADAVARQGETLGVAIAQGIARGNLDETKYVEYVKIEADAFRGARFDDELERVAAKVGAPLREETVRDDLIRVAMGNLHNRHGAQQAFAQRMRQLTTPEPERLARPALADAFLGHLVNASMREHLHGTALRYLAWVPLRAFHRAALERVRLVIDHDVLRAGMWVHATEPEWVVSALNHHNPATRGHAAAIIGLADDLARLPELERALENESDDFVRPMIHFALVRLGEHEHLAELIVAAQSSTDLVALQALALLEGLPPDLKATVPLSVLIAAARGQRHPVVGFTAAMVLCDLGSVKPLDGAALSAVLDTAVELERSELPEVRVGADMLVAAIAGLAQLDRHAVLSAVRQDHAPQRAWLARWAKVAQRSDLPLLDRAIARAKLPGEAMAAITVLAAIPGVEAQAQLERWFAEHEGLRPLIAVQLVLRGDVDKQRLARLSAEHDDDPSSTIFDLALAQPTVNARLDHYLRSGDPGERHTAALAIKLFGTPAHALGLWLNAGYHSDRIYPADVRLRQIAISALLDLALNRAALKAPAATAAR